MGIVPGRGEAIQGEIVDINSPISGHGIMMIWPIILNTFCLMKQH